MVGVELEPIENLACDHLALCAGHEPVVKEDGRPRVADPANADLLLPEAGLELAPPPLILGLDVRPRLEEALEHEVLDEVGGRELGAPGIEGLEDLLRVLVGGQVDHHDLQELPRRGLDDGRTTRDLGVAISHEPLPSLGREASMGLDHALARVPSRGVVHRQLCGHDRLERRPIAVRGPDLELVLGLRAEGLRVGDQGLDPHRRLRSTDCDQLGTQRIKQELQGRQPLLTVDDGPLLHVPGRARHLLQNNGAEEVGLVPISWSLEHPTRDAGEVLPQRLPLALLVPDIRPLEQRDDQPLRLHDADMVISRDGEPQRRQTHPAPPASRRASPRACRRTPSARRL